MYTVHCCVTGYHGHSNEFTAAFGLSAQKVSCEELIWG